MIYFANAPCPLFFQTVFQIGNFLSSGFNSDTVSCIDLISGLVSDDPLEKLTHTPSSMQILPMSFL
jgi:hypothetical protein